MARSDFGAPFFLATVNALSGTAEQIFAERDTRRYVIIKNIDASISVGVGDADDVSTTNGMVLLAGESVRIDTTAAIWAEAASGTPSVSLIEVYD